MKKSKSIFSYYKEFGDAEFPAYKTEDDKYNVLVRDDGYHLLYKHNEKTGDYEWVETYFLTLEECEGYVLKEERK